MATVLVVDDAAFMRTMLKDILVEAGHWVIGEGGTGEEAIQLYAALKPDLITLDVVMPQQSGVTTVHAILALDAKARIIMVSSSGQMEIAEEALRAGAKAFIPKPFEPESVKECIRKVLSQ